MEESLEVALSRCRGAWVEFFKQHSLHPDSITFEDGSPIKAWCLHYLVEVGNLSKPIETYIDSILRDKRRPEQVCRLSNFRPVSLASLKVLEQALSKYERACTLASVECAELTTMAQTSYWSNKGLSREGWRRVAGQAQAAFWRALDQLTAKYRKLQLQVHTIDVPHNTWNGYSTFSWLNDAPKRATELKRPDALASTIAARDTRSANEDPS